MSLKKLINNKLIFVYSTNNKKHIIENIGIIATSFYIDYWNINDSTCQINENTINHYLHVHHPQFEKCNVY